MLKLREVIQFEEVTGLDYSEAMTSTQMKVCRTHRLAIQHCKECLQFKGRRACDEHIAATAECDTCVKATVSRAIVSGLALVVMRRSNADLTWDELLELDYEQEILPAALGELVGGSPEAPSSDGSPASSPNSAASRRKRSGI